MGKRGGARPGAGRPKGSMDEDTKLRRNAERNYKERVAKLTDKLLDSQLAIALGESNLYRIKVVNKGKKNERKEVDIIEDPQVVKEYFLGEIKDTDAEYYYISTKSPDSKTIDSLLNRTYGKPKESVDLTSGDKPIPILGATIVSSSDIDEEAPETQEED